MCIRDSYRALGGGWYSNRPLLDRQTTEQMRQRTDWGDLLDEAADTETASHD